MKQSEDYQEAYRKSANSRKFGRIAGSVIMLLLVVGLYVLIRPGFLSPAFIVLFLLLMTVPIAYLSVSKTDKINERIGLDRVSVSDPSSMASDQSLISQFPELLASPRRVKYCNPVFPFMRWILFNSVFPLGLYFYFTGEEQKTVQLGMWMMVIGVIFSFLMFFLLRRKESRFRKLIKTGVPVVGTVKNFKVRTEYYNNKAREFRTLEMIYEFNGSQFHEESEPVGKAEAFKLEQRIVLLVDSDEPKSFSIYSRDGSGDNLFRAI